MNSIKPELLKAALFPFSDPATEPSFLSRKSGLKIQITRNGDALEVSSNQNDAIELKCRNRVKRFNSLASALASEDLADLKRMAAIQSGLYPNPNEKDYISLKFDVDSERISESEIKSRLEVGHKRTVIMLLEGPAGIGKSYFLKRLCASRAVEYATGSGRPLLYISSKGRRLSNLPDTLAAATQDVRANFTYEQVPTLVRFGTLDIAIDGFDELVDADGYEDAWLALRQFIDSLSGSGRCILAGRDTFFDAQGFVDRLNVAVDQIHLIKARVVPVSKRDATEWLRAKGWSETELENPMMRQWLQDDSYALRPYFLSQLAEQNPEAFVQATSSPRVLLVKHFLRREARLVQKTVGCSEEEALGIVRYLLEEVASDMAIREVGYVDSTFLSFICDNGFDSDGISREGLRKLAHKISSIGLLERSYDSKHREFPHTEVWYHFLALGLVRNVLGGHLPLYLRRSRIGLEFFAVLSEVLEGMPASYVEAFFEKLEECCRKEMLVDSLMFNCSGVFLSSMSVLHIQKPAVISDLDVNEWGPLGSCRRVRVENSHFGKLDVRGADLRMVVFERCTIGVLVCDNVTRYGVGLPSIDCLLDSSGERRIRDPRQIADYLDAKVPRGEDAARLSDAEQYLLRLLTRAARFYYFKEGAEDASAALLHSEYWPVVRRVLESENRIESVVRQTGGFAGPLLHFRNARELVSGFDSDPVALRIRKAVRESVALRD